MRQRVALVARGDEFQRFFVVLGMRFGVFNHALNFFFAQTRAGLNLDLVFLAGGFVLGRHMQNAVGVDVKSDFNLRHAALRRRNIRQIELAERLVGLGDFALALQHVDGYRRLIILGGRKHLIRLGRNGGVFVDEFGHHAAQRFDAERQRRHVEQQHVFHVAFQHARLNGGAHSHGFVGVDVFARLFAEQFFYFLLHLRHARLTADENHVRDVGNFYAGILDRHFAGLDGALDQFFDQRLEFCTRDFDCQVLRA